MSHHDVPAAPAGSFDAHLDVDVLADLTEGLLDEPAREAARRHLDGCAHCRGVEEDLRALPGLLRAAFPVPGPVPVDVAERVHAALHEAAAEREPPPVPRPVGVPRPTPGARLASLLPRLVPVAGLAAVLLGVVVVGSLLLSLLDLGGGDEAQDSAAGGAAEEAFDGDGGAVEQDPGAPEAGSGAALEGEGLPQQESSVLAVPRGPLTVTVRASGRDYASATLPDAGRLLLQGGSDGGQDAGTDGPASVYSYDARGELADGTDEARRSVVGEVPGALEPLAEPDRLYACLALVAAGTVEGASVDLATFGGQPAAVVAAPVGDEVELSVVGPSCGAAGDAALLDRLVVPHIP